MSSPFDIAVIGGGAAGCAAATEAARQGARVVLVERKRLLGGAAWLRTRLPSRMLQQAAAQLMGGYPHTRTDPASIELAKLLPELDARRLAHSTQLGTALADHRILRLHARARLVGNGGIDLTSVRGEQHRIEARHILLATGDRTVSVPWARIDHERVLDPGSALSAVFLPRTLVVVGSSPAAVEMAGLFAALGTQTWLVVEEHTVLPGFDSSLADAFLASFQVAGGRVLWGHTVLQSGKDGQGGARCTLQAIESGEERTLTVDRILVATRREATGRSLGLEAMGIQRNEAGHLRVDDHFRTTNDTISAIGSAVGAGTSPTRIAHQAQRAVAAILEGRPTPASPKVFVDTILSLPELASVGAPESAVQRGLSASVYDGRSGLKLVVGHRRHVVGLHAWGHRAESRLEGLRQLVQDSWSLEQVAQQTEANFADAREAARSLLSPERSLDDLVIDPDDLLAGVLPTGTSAA